ncbi:MAG TPA: pyridoxamine 5'-phosphate oxidase family protein [Bacteroidales bacterium]|mgnify:FL=1|nr:pyridoxamine 5'-phosphate oxidase family protein [Bacteroidales bacterium]HQI69474.1 pyridoxamine 5'-phosphate oxidase family protein [Bacteroidales bacterium]
MLTTKEDIVDFIRKNPLAFVATADGSQPRVRGIMIHDVDDKGIILTTGKNKDFYKQLTTNPGVELCFYANNTQVRVTGVAVEADDELELKKEIVSTRPFMQPWIEMAGYGIMGLFRISQCKATVWSSESPMARKRFVDLFA